jgi:hypothetical protein
VDGTGGMHGGGERFWLGGLKGRDHWEDLAGP